MTVGLLAAALANPAHACDVRLDGAFASLKSERFQAAARTDPRRVVPAVPFAVEIVVCAAGAQGLPESVAVDAHMPAHRHGMNYRTVTTATAPGRYRSEGFFFHMPGIWEFAIELRAGDKTDRLTATIVVE
ncbi:MAG: hypothetical protein ACREC6_10600 [Hyphomicrobiaceae bacterium]